ncbi:hypothetical protein TrLO_g15564 [Triparma laevis f. longispina]|nr:hypothetical protein TrLO_g15564 [Triparma laevis f. longispina]
MNLPDEIVENHDTLSGCACKNGCVCYEDYSDIPVYESADRVSADRVNADRVDAESLRCNSDKRNKRRIIDDDDLLTTKSRRSKSSRFTELSEERENLLKLLNDYKESYSNSEHCDCGPFDECECEGNGGNGISDEEKCILVHQGYSHSQIRKYEKDMVRPNLRPIYGTPDLGLPEGEERDFESEEREQEKVMEEFNGLLEREIGGEEVEREVEEEEVDEVPPPPPPLPASVKEEPNTTTITTTTSTAPPTPQPQPQPLTLTYKKEHPFTTIKKLKAALLISNTRYISGNPSTIQRYKRTILDQVGKLSRLENRNTDLIKQGVECQERLLEVMGEIEFFKKGLNDERRSNHDLKVEIQQTSKKERDIINKLNKEKRSLIEKNLLLNEEINRAESRGEHGVEDVKRKLRDEEYKNEEMKKKYRKLEAQYEAIAGIVQRSMGGAMGEETPNPNQYQPKEKYIKNKAGTCPPTQTHKTNRFLDPTLNSTFHPHLPDKSLTSKKISHKLQKRKSEDKGTSALAKADSYDDRDLDVDDDESSLEVEMKVGLTVVDYSSDSSIEISERVTTALHGGGEENENVNVASVFQTTQKKVKNEFNSNKLGNLNQRLSTAPKFPTRGLVQSGPVRKKKKTVGVGGNTGTTLVMKNASLNRFFGKK